MEIAGWVYFAFGGKTKVNWKKLPFREGSISILISKGKKHKGEIKVSIWNSSLGFGRNIGKDQYFKTKAAALEFISTIAFSNIMEWIE